MELNTLKCNHLTPQRFKGLNVYFIIIIILFISCS